MTVGVGVGQVLVNWLSGIDTECECAVPVVMMVPGGSWASATLTNVAREQDTKSGATKNFRESTLYDGDSASRKGKYAEIISTFIPLSAIARAFMKIELDLRRLLIGKKFD